jgi:hypothetical protein
MEILPVSKENSGFNHIKKNVLDTIYIMNTDEELWKETDIAGYWISTWGRIRYNHNIKEPCIAGGGHLQMSLVRPDRTRVFRYIHRLVGCAFLEPVEDCPLIDHIDRDKSNNHISNLRWASHSLNAQNCRNARTPTEQVLKQREYIRAWREANKDRVKQYMANYKDNKKKIQKAERDMIRKIIETQKMELLKTI